VRTQRSHHDALLGVFLAAVGVILLAAAAARAQRDHLTGLEADRIRAAESPALRIKLFVSYADDRLKKFQYELSRTTFDKRRPDRLRALLDQYAACLDDAVQLIDLGIEKQQEIREGVKETQAKGKEFLAYLEKLAADKAASATYGTSLEDAIDSTQEALKSAEKAAKEMAPPPVRRR
jgi:hypothetical protein